MKTQYYLILIVLSSLFVFLEWGGTQQSFLWEAEWTVLSNSFTNFKDFLHPFVGIPLVGQIILIINALKKNPARIWVYTGIAAMAILVIFIALVGLLSLNAKIILSTLPFLIFSIITVVRLRKESRNF